MEILIEELQLKDVSRNCICAPWQVKLWRGYFVVKKPRRTILGANVLFYKNTPEDLVKYLFPNRRDGKSVLQKQTGYKVEDIPL